MMFRALSQTGIHYRGSPVCSGKVGPIEGGDRLPWVAIDGTDNYAGLDGLGWQVHVYGTPGAGLAEACRERGWTLRTFPWHPSMARAGLTEDTVYVVRPDGHVATLGSGLRVRSRPDPQT
jgi:hypothetical protein